MSVTQTSLEAYESVKLNKNEEVVYHAIEHLGATTNDGIADYLNWPIQSVTGRTNALFAKNLICVLDHNGTSRMGRKAKRWAVKDVNDKNLKEIAGDSMKAVSWMND